MQNKLRILQIGRYFPPHIGGTENVIFDLTEGLTSMGHACDVLCCSDTGQYLEETKGAYRVFRTKTILKVGSIAISAQQIIKLKKLWRNYDIIHIHHPAPMATVALWLINPRCKIVIYWHSDIVRQKTLLLLFKPLQNWLLKKADAIVATSPEYIKASEALKKYPDKTSFVQLGIEGLERTVDVSPPKKAKDFQHKKIVFSLGRLVEYKGYQFLIDAAQYLDNDTVILIGGEGRLKSDLALRIQQNGLWEKVKLLGKLTNEEVAHYFKICNVFCLPSITKNEAFGLVLLEAMSMGKPVVATQIPGSGVAWVNEDSVSGLNVPIENSEALAQAIKKILNDENVECEFRKNARLRFNQYFKREIMVRSFVDLYRRIQNS